MLPVSAPLPDKGAPVSLCKDLSATEDGPQCGGFCSGTDEQDFSSTDAAVGLVSIQTVCTDVSAADEVTGPWQRAEIDRLGLDSVLKR